MSIEAKYIYVVQLGTPPEKEAEFNKLYNEEHLPALLEVPGVLGATRYETSDEEGPKYLAIYELDGPSVPESDAWKKASNSGEWAPKVRPHITSRRRLLYKRIHPAG